MVKEAMLTRVECPVCGHRLMDKGGGSRWSCANKMHKM